MTEELLNNGMDEAVQTTQENATDEAVQATQENKVKAEDNSSESAAVVIPQPKTDAELISEANERIAALESKMIMKDLHVKEDVMDDVLILAKSRINENTNMEQAINDVINHYPEFREGVVIPHITTSVSSLLASPASFLDGNNDDFGNGLKGKIMEDYED